MRAICIPMYRYTPQVGEFYKVYFKNLLNNLHYWKGEFDHLYLIDQEWGFSQEDIDQIKQICPNVTILVSTVYGHHWSQFKWAIPQIKEDRILFLDNDIIFYRSGIIDGWFKKSEEGCDIVTAFDGSGGLQEQIAKKYPSLLPHNRMGSYYFILTKSLLEKIPVFDFAPVTYTPGTVIPELDYTTVEGDWSDSFGLFTIKWLALYPQVFEIVDDRSSIYLEGDTIHSVPEKSLNLGYYHIRNGNLPVYMLNSKYYGYEKDYRHSLAITPPREALRILSFYQILNSESEHINGILEDLFVPKTLWETYVQEVKNYHHFDEK